MVFVVAPKILSQIDPAILAKLKKRLSGLRVERIEVVHHSREDSLFFSVRPVSYSSRPMFCLNAGIELPKELSSGSIQSDYFLRWRVREKNPLDDQRVCLDDAFFPGVVGPLDLEFRHIGPVDLGQGGQC